MLYGPQGQSENGKDRKIHSKAFHVQQTLVQGSVFFDADRIMQNLLQGGISSFEIENRRASLTSNSCDNPICLSFIVSGSVML